MTDERQAELDRWVDELYRVVNSITELLYERREHALRLDPTVAFLVGALWAAERLTDRSGT